MLEKNEARARIRSLRSRLTPEEKEEKSLAAANQALRLLAGCEKVLCYADLPSEMGTGPLAGLLKKAGVRVAFPRVEGKDIAFYEAEMEDLLPGSMGIREPRCGEPVYWPDAPVVTPGLAFDREGGRAGYGAGFYDRFFDREPDHPTVGFCFEFQVTEPLRLEAHDRRMDWVVTEKQIHDCGRTLENGKKEDSFGTAARRKGNLI